MTTPPSDSFTTKLLQEALTFHFEKPVQHIGGPDHTFIGDFSSRGLALMRDLFDMEPIWMNTALGQERVIFSKDGIVLELN